MYIMIQLFNYSIRKSNNMQYVLIDFLSIVLWVRSLLGELTSWNGVVCCVFTPIIIIMFFLHRINVLVNSCARAHHSKTTTPASQLPYYSNMLTCLPVCRVRMHRTRFKKWMCSCFHRINFQISYTCDDVCVCLWLFPTLVSWCGENVVGVSACINAE